MRCHAKVLDSGVMVGDRCRQSIVNDMSLGLDRWLGPPSPDGNVPTGQSEQTIEDGRQRVVKRSWKYNLLPGIVLFISSCDVIWEVLRANLAATSGPFSVQLIPVAPAANIAGAFAGLLFARSQYARSVRPSLTWSARLTTSPSIPASGWAVHLANVGPGLANVSEVSYTLEAKAPNDGSLRCAGSRKDVTQLLERAGLLFGVDYHLQLVTRDAPLPVAKSAAEGIEFAVFSIRSLKIIERLDFRVRVVDILGDEHEKSLPLMATVPKHVLLVHSESNLAGTTSA